VAYATLAEDDFYAELTILDSNTTTKYHLTAPGAIPVSFSTDGHFLVYAAQSENRVDSLFAIDLTTLSTNKVASVQISNKHLAPGAAEIVHTPYTQTVKWIGSHLQYTNPGDAPVDIDLSTEGGAP
jgi:hypothetical protein